MSPRMVRLWPDENPEPWKKGHDNHLEWAHHLHSRPFVCFALSRLITRYWLCRSAIFSFICSHPLFLYKTYISLLSFYHSLSFPLPTFVRTCLRSSHGVVSSIFLPSKPLMPKRLVKVNEEQHYIAYDVHIFFSSFTSIQIITTSLVTDTHAAILITQSFSDVVAGVSQWSQTFGHW